MYMNQRLQQSVDATGTQGHVRGGTGRIRQGASVVIRADTPYNPKHLCNNHKVTFMCISGAVEDDGFKMDPWIAVIVLY
jgi:hypothetical protein